MKPVFGVMKPLFGACIFIQKTQKAGPRQIIQIGEKSIDYNSDFRLYLCSRNSQMEVDETVKAAVAKICFSVTQTGLASQILGLAITIEKPDLETRSSELMREAEQMKIKLDGIEQSLLNRNVREFGNIDGRDLKALASSEGSLLDNASLLDSLNKSKENAETIAASLAEADKLQKQLIKEKEVYQPLAQTASTLYFAVSELHKHNPVYNFSVNTIITLYKRTFNKVTGSADALKRIEELRNVLRRDVYEYVSRALFRKDRLMFSMHFIYRTQPALFAQNVCLLFMSNEKTKPLCIRSVSERRRRLLSNPSDTKWQQRPRVGKFVDDFLCQKLIASLAVRF
ncbi:unnamed protein product [Gongylonema pulchrum]|uniref:AAA_9 domain-containing protein n=1 Tax=Gongylonema pulchrum TaxID=637853 RepID=A0A183DVU2_9BILA|nr:unnamed protein product [Gongylonema pulchrum]